MKAVILPLIIFMLTTGITIAEKHDKVHNRREGFTKERVLKLQGGKYSRMFLSMLQKTKALNLSDEQKEMVNVVAKKYIESIVDEENQSRTLQRQFLKELQDEVFDPTKLKTLAKERQGVDLKAADSFIDGVTEIKEAIGPENFAKLLPLTKVNRNALVQLKEENTKK